MKLTIAPFLTLSILVLFSVQYLAASGSVEHEVVVNPYRVIADVWDGPWWAQIIEFEDGREIHWIWGIKDFSNYSIGTEYRIRIREKKISNPPVDTPDTEYILLETISEKTIPLVENVEIQIGTIGWPFLTPGENGKWVLLNDEDVEITGNIKDSDIILALFGSFKPIGIFSVKSGRYYLEELEYEFVPELFIDNLIEISGNEPEMAIIDRILETPRDELSPILEKEIILLFEYLISLN